MPLSLARDPEELREPKSPTDGSPWKNGMSATGMCWLLQCTGPTTKKVITGVLQITSSVVSVAVHVVQAQQNGDRDRSHVSRAGGMDQTLPFYSSWSLLSPDPPPRQMWTDRDLFAEDKTCVIDRYEIAARHSRRRHESLL